MSLMEKVYRINMNCFGFMEGMFDGSSSVPFAKEEKGLNFLKIVKQTKSKSDLTQREM